VGTGEVIEVLLVDDDHLMRAGLGMIIEQTLDLTVVGEAEDGRQAVTAAGRDHPDVVVMDVRMPVMDGIEATRHITAVTDPPRVLILTTFELDEYVFNALRAGASGFLLKRSPPEQLIEAIRTVAAGDALLAPSVTQRLIAEFSTRPVREVDPRFADLTDREREVLIAVARGLTNEELAEALFISANTVKTHIKRILAKLDARDRVQAVVMAYEGGLMDGS
jgi:DNA-binding NarL/FixJ family response regulator